MLKKPNQHLSLGEWAFYNSATAFRTSASGIDVCQLAPCVLHMEQRGCRGGRVWSVFLLHVETEEFTKLGGENPSVLFQKRPSELLSL